MFSKKNFATRLKELRKSHKVTALELSKTLDISKAAISQFENEANYPHCNTLCALADYFDVTVDYLIGRSDDATPLSFRSSFQKELSEHLLEIIPTLDETDLEATGYSKDELYCLADMEHQITFNEACNIADTLGISLDYLVGRTDKPEINR